MRVRVLAVMQRGRMTITPRSVYWAVSGSVCGFLISHAYRWLVRRRR
jgi:hypothetical protein